MGIISILFSVLVVLTVMFFLRGNIDLLQHFFLKILISLGYGCITLLLCLSLSLTLTMLPINKPIIVKQDTIFISPFSEQNFFMIENIGNEKYNLYYLSNEKTSNRMCKLNDFKYKVDTISKYAYVIKYKIVSKDSTIQKLIIGHKKEMTVDTVFIPDIKMLKVI